MPLNPLESIVVGAYANDGTGDDLRTAFQKVNRNFASVFGDLTLTTAANIGTGAGIWAQTVDTELQLKSIKGNAGSYGIVVSSDATTITVTGLSAVQGDTHPTLGGNLNLNSHNIVGIGDVQTSVYGVDVRDLNMQVQALYGDLDLGTFENPYVGGIDLGVF
jgi:hypothetical protein